MTTINGERKVYIVIAETFDFMNGCYDMSISKSL
jgi:hypothetical protein